jgi:hypothetical protein
MVKRKRTTPRDEQLLPLPFAKVSPDTPGAWGQTERGNNPPPVAGEVLVDQVEPEQVAARLDAAGAVAMSNAPSLRHVDVEVDDDYDVHCVQHPDRPTWFVVVWARGARERARAAGRGPEGDVLDSARYLAGGELFWYPRRGEHQLDDDARARIARAVVAAVDTATGGAT